MITVLSPAKSLNFEPQNLIKKSTSIDFPDKTQVLVKKLKRLSSKKIGNLMSLSPKLSDLNYERYQSFSESYDLKNAKQAILSFTGDVYRGLNADDFNEKDFDFAQNHVRILSGLYGLIKPLDLIQPYRLEMGTKFEVNAKTKNLYGFWKETVTAQLNEKLKGEILINLASNEYFKAVDVKKLNSDVLTINFKDNKNGQYKSIMTYAKLARGYMTNFIVKNKIDDLDALKAFDYEGYIFNQEMSKDLDWTFTRG